MDNILSHMDVMIARHRCHSGDGDNKVIGGCKGGNGLGPLDEQLVEQRMLRGLKEPEAGGTGEGWK